MSLDDLAPLAQRGITFLFMQKVIKQFRYTTLFAAEQLLSYDLGELGHFHRAYEQLMAHWRALLPSDRFLEVRYEDVVDDLSGQARRMVDWLGLPWEDACMHFNEPKRTVRTASVSQVRLPIYSSSKDRTLPYREYLRPLLEALNPNGLDSV